MRTLRTVAFCLVLASLVAGPLIPVAAQEGQPSQLRQLYYQELAKYYDMVNQYNSLVESYQSATGGAGPNSGPNFAGARQMISQINGQWRKVQALKKALDESGEGGARR